MFYVGNDDVVVGCFEVEVLMKVIGGKGNIVMIEGFIGQFVQIECVCGNDEVLVCNKDVKVLVCKIGNWLCVELMVLMENWFIVYFGQIKGVLVQNDDEVLGVLQVIKVKGIDFKIILVVGIDGIVDVIVVVKCGEMVIQFQDVQV